MGSNSEYHNSEYHKSVLLSWSFGSSESRKAINKQASRETGYFQIMITAFRKRNRVTGWRETGKLSRSCGQVQHVRRGTEIWMLRRMSHRKTNWWEKHSQNGQNQYRGPWLGMQWEELCLIRDIRDFGKTSLYKDEPPRCWLGLHLDWFWWSFH